MKRRKRRPECVAPRVTEAPASVLYGTLRLGHMRDLELIPPFSILIDLVSLT